jgi:hypothetical protein
MKFLINILLLLLGNPIKASNEESRLYNSLLRNYSKNVRPVSNYEETITTQLGLGVQTLESFDQMQETISLNIWVRMNWNDDFLTWSSDKSNLTFLSLSPDDIWTPDLELINAAKKPDIYTLKGGLYLYNSGLVIWSRPSILTFQCSLDLHLFPFDKQNCTMKISSWVYNQNQLNLIPNENEESQIDILSSFSHSEWELHDYELRTLEEERDCCPDEIFDVLSYSFILKRYPHYYKISMGMTITLVLVSFIIMLMAADNISRTGTAVFIPLTILALQLTIADKIAVVGYYTLMDYFFLLCFITSMLCSIESGLVYAFLTVRSVAFYDYLDKKFNIILPEKDEEVEKNLNNSLSNQEANSDANSGANSDANSGANSDANREFMETINELDSTSNDNNSLSNQSSNYSSKSSLSFRTPSYVATIRNRYNRNIDDVKISKNVYKMINYDDKRLFFTEKQEYIDSLVTKYICRIDTFFRIFLPLMYFSLLIVIYSYEE